MNKKSKVDTLALGLALLFASGGMGGIKSFAAALVDQGNTLQAVSYAGDSIISLAPDTVGVTILRVFSQVNTICFLRPGKGGCGGAISDVAKVSSLDDKNSKIVNSKDHPVHIWAQVLYDRQKQDIGAVGIDAYSTNSKVLVLGADTTLNDHNQAGIYFSFGKSDVTYSNTKVDNKDELTTYTGSFYSMYKPDCDRFVLVWGAIGGRNIIESQGKLRPSSQTTKSQYSKNEVILYSSLNVPKKFANRSVIVFNIAGYWRYSNAFTYDRQEVGLQSTQMDMPSSSSFNTAMNLRYYMGKIRLRDNARMVYALYGQYDRTVYSNGFNNMIAYDANTSTYRVLHSDIYNKNKVTLGGILTLASRRKWEVEATYMFSAAHKYTSHTFGLKGKIIF